MREGSCPVMTAEEIGISAPQSFEEDRVRALERARARVEAAGQWSARQHLGRRWPVGCVALEITQRCNLDCTLCYLSESSQALKDLPLEEVYRRIDMIRAQYVEGVDVQITGGEPSLRPRAELAAIVRRARGLPLTVFFNTSVCGASLDDVPGIAAFFLRHADVVRLSAIFAFYPEDFRAGAPGPIAYVNARRSMPVPADYRVECADYDWTVADREIAQK